jgi:hypothetical protein
MTRDMQQLNEDFHNCYELPKDDKRFKLLSEDSMRSLRPGCLIGWYFKEDLDFWQSDGRSLPEQPCDMPYQGIGILLSGMEWRGGSMETENVVIAQFTYPTEKCYPDGQWFTLHRLLDAPDLAAIVVVRSAERPIQGPMGPTVVVKTDGVPTWKA